MSDASNTLNESSDASFDLLATIRSAGRSLTSTARRLSGRGVFAAAMMASAHLAIAQAPPYQYFCPIDGNCPPPNDLIRFILGNPADIAGPHCDTVCIDPANPSPVSMAQAGDPINIASGNVFETVVDYSTVGENKLSFTRYYNSMGQATFPNTFATSLGTNWRSNYDRYLHISGTNLMAERADGQVLTFALQNGVWTPGSFDANQNNKWIAATDVDVKIVNIGSTWTLTDTNDAVETYTVDGTGKGTLNSIKQRDGYTQTLNRSNGQLESVTDSYGRSLGFSYAGKQLQSLSTPDGLTLNYGFAAAGTSVVLSKVGYPNSGTNTSYLYENTALPFAMTGLLDENNNRYASWTYDTATGRALTSSLGNGTEAIGITYNDPYGLRTVTNALGQVTVYRFQTEEGVLKLLNMQRDATATTVAAYRQFSYTPTGFLASSTDWNGNGTYFTRDAHGQATSITSTAQNIQIAYDTTWVHEPAKITTDRSVTDITYDGSGNPATKTETDTTTQTVPYSTNGMARSWSYSWSSTGLIQSLTGPRGDVTTFVYDNTGALTTITNALNQTTSVTSHTPGGLPLTTVDPNGVTTRLAYDDRLRLHTKTLETSAGPLTTSWTVDPVGNLTGFSLPDGSGFTYSYNVARQLTGIEDMLGNKIALVTDLLGNNTSIMFFDSSGVLTYQHSATYDALGQIITDVGAQGQTTKYVHDKAGNIASVTDPKGNVTTATYGPLNHLMTLANAAHGVMRITWNKDGEIVTVAAPNAGQTQFVYSGTGDVIQQKSPDTGLTVTWHDAAGNVTKTQNANGNVATTTWDILNRPLVTAFAGDPTLTVTRTYDEPGHGFGTGRMTSMVDSAGALARTYDERGLITQETRAIGSSVLTTGYTYDNVERVSGILYPSGLMLAYGRGVAGDLTSVTAKIAGQSVPIITGATYMPFGPLATMKDGSGVATTRIIDQDYRLTAQTVTGTAPIQKLDYSYDLNGNATTMTDAMNPSDSWTYTYDVMNRLSAAQSGPSGYGSWAWTWDANSNRKTQTVNGTTTTYDYNIDNRLGYIITPGQAEQIVGSDAAGNVVNFKTAAGTLTNLTYNDAGKLAAVTTASQAATYLYDGEQRRVEKRRAGMPALIFQNAPDGTLLSENDNHGTQADYVYMNGEPIAEVSNGKLFFTHTDRRGLPQVLTDNNQSVAWKGLYEPFGSTNLSGFSGTLATQSLRLPGQYFDPETGNNNNGYRYYNSQIGRYLSSDPIGLNGGLNTYEYALGNPLGNVDPSGLSCNAVGGTVTCTPPGGPTVSFPEPAGWPTTIDSNSQNYHSYNIPVTSVGPCKSNPMQTIINNPTPGGNNQPATPQGTPNDATPPSMTWFGPSQVTSYSTKDSNGNPVVINVTVKGHPLSPGYVVRTATPGPGDTWTINNYGEGTNWKQGPLSPFRNYINNQWIGQSQSLLNSCGCGSK